MKFPNIVIVDSSGRPLRIYYIYNNYTLDFLMKFSQKRL